MLTFEKCDSCIHKKNSISIDEFPCCECCHAMNGDVDMYINENAIIGVEDNRQIIKDSGKRRVFETGAVRDIQEGKGRCDLMPLDVVAECMEDTILWNIALFQMLNDVTYLENCIKNAATKVFTCWEEMFLEVSIHFENGAKKYGENNWQKGLPVNCYIDSAVRHYLKWLRCDKDERHDRAFVWNIMCCIWTIKHIGKGNEK